MFGTLNEKLEKIVKSIAGRATISEDDLDITLREIRIALLEADVALSVVKDFIDNVKSNIVGKEVLKSIKPDQMIIKLVQEELIKILGLNNEPLNIAKTGITKILFCGLQGSGKTTTIAKVANFIKKNSKKKILLVFESHNAKRPQHQPQKKQGAPRHAYVELKKDPHRKQQLWGLDLNPDTLVLEACPMAILSRHYQRTH